MGIRGWVEGSDCFIVYSAGGDRRAAAHGAGGIVAQTTTPQALYDGLCASSGENPGVRGIRQHLQGHRPSPERGERARRAVDVMLVVGGRNRLQYAQALCALFRDLQAHLFH